MRDLRFSAIVLVTVLSSAAWTQTPNPATTQQLPLPESGQSQNQTPAITPAAPMVQNDKSKGSPLEHFELKEIPDKPPRDEKIPIGSFDRGSRAALQPGMVERRLVAPFEVAEDFRKALDRGIRLNPAGAGMCGSIVSYNFSISAPGEVPHLESITTCTPADKVVQRHAQNSRRKSTAPQLLKTSSPER